MTLSDWDYRVIRTFRGREFKDYQNKKVKLDYEDHVLNWSNSPPAIGMQAIFNDLKKTFPDWELYQVFPDTYGSSNAGGGYVTTQICIVLRRPAQGSDSSGARS